MQQMLHVQHGNRRCRSVISALQNNIRTLQNVLEHFVSLMGDAHIQMSIFLKLWEVKKLKKEIKAIRETIICASRGPYGERETPDVFKAKADHFIN